MKGMSGGVPRFGGHKNYGNRMGRVFGPNGLANQQAPNAGNATWQQGMPPGMEGLGGPGFAAMQNPGMSGMKAPRVGPQNPGILQNPSYQLNPQDQQQQMLGQQQMASMLRSGQTGGFGG